MLLTNRSLLTRTASVLGWRTMAERTADEAPLPDVLQALTESAVAGGYSAGIALGFRLPIKSPVCMAFGQANLETRTPVDRETSFHAGACTRQLTAAAILLLAERSELRLDDTINVFLPGEPGADELSLRALLLADRAAHALFGRIVEQVTGESFVDFATENLLIPAGMQNSRFADPTQIIPHRAAGYRLASERAHDFHNVGAGHGPICAEGLYTTAGDLLLWNRALYSGRLLSRGMVELMTTAGAQGTACPILEPFLSRHGRGFGLDVGRLFGRRAFWQRGQAPGFDAWLFHFPDDRIDLALLANTEEGAATVLEPMLRAILRV